MCTVLLCGPCPLTTPASQQWHPVMSSCQSQIHVSRLQCQNSSPQYRDMSQEKMSLAQLYTGATSNTSFKSHKKSVQIVPVLVKTTSGSGSPNFIISMTHFLLQNQQCPRSKVPIDAIVIFLLCTYNCTHCVPMIAIFVAFVPFTAIKH